MISGSHSNEMIVVALSYVADFYSWNAFSFKLGYCTHSTCRFKTLRSQAQRLTNVVWYLVHLHARCYFECLCAVNLPLGCCICHHLIRTLYGCCFVADQEKWKYDSDLRLCLNLLSSACAYVCSYQTSFSRLRTYLKKFYQNCHCSMAFLEDE